MIIRDATEKDAAAIASIFRYYVEETAISFEYETPTDEAMRRKIIESANHLPYLVAEENNRILGYVYAHPFSQREAYRISAEVTIYLDKDCTGKGIGKALYEELEQRLRGTEVRNLYAIVMYPGYGSIEFHEKMGYKTVGKLTDCGMKFGKLWSVVYMEKKL